MGLKKLTFRGGVHPKDNKKLSESSPIESIAAPPFVSIAMHQHVGAPCESTVELGAYVRIGDVIGSTEAFVSAPIHASISGTIKEINDIATPNGVSTKAIIIENDFKDEIAFTKVYRELKDLSEEDLIKIIRDAGITGLGGASFPSHIKYSPPKDKKIDTVIINGAECEPYLTADQLVMETESKKIVLALKAIMKVVSAEKGYIAIEDNKPKAIGAMKEAVGDSENIEVAVLKTKYPQGDEKRVIDAILKRAVPVGGLPMDVGAVVSNVATSLAIYNAVYENIPLYERVMTVTGNPIKNPKNILVRIGTPLNHVLEAVGGFKEKPGKLIAGGPMMGAAIANINSYTIKGMGGLLALTEKEAEPPVVSNCINCGRCIDVCPMYLEPVQISRSVSIEDYDRAQNFEALACVECGACSYTCPARRPLVEHIRLAKREIRAKMQNR